MDEAEKRTGVAAATEAPAKTRREQSGDPLKDWLRAEDREVGVKVMKAITRVICGRLGTK